MIRKNIQILAEREGFEPSEPARVHLISNQARSATPPPLLYSYRDSARRLSPAVHLIYSGLLPSPLFPRGCIIIQVTPLLLIGIPEIHIRKTLCKRLFLSLALIFAIIIFLFNGLPKLLNATVLDRVMAHKFAVAAVDALDDGQTKSIMTFKDGSYGLQGIKAS